VDERDDDVRKVSSSEKPPQPRGEKWQDTGLVFTTTRGTPLDPRNVLRQFARVLEAGGIPHVRFHDLRHSCATLLLCSGRFAARGVGHPRAFGHQGYHGHLQPRHALNEGLRSASDGLGSRSLS